MSTWQKILSTSGASAGGGGGGGGADDVFSTYLYTGTGAAQTITNGVDLATHGGMVWIKNRNNSEDNNIVDTSRGGDNMLYTNQNIEQFSLTGLGFSVFSFFTNGFTYSNGSVNAMNNYTYVSWTFRKAPKFFTICSWTGSGVARTISHDLGCVPGMIIVKRTDATGDWVVYHKSIPANYINLNYTSAASVSASVFYWGNDSTNIQPTSTVFSIGSASALNASGGTYVAYLFADSDSGGFGPNGDQSIVACGSFTGNTTVNLGWEPQYILLKRTDAVGDWRVLDNLRGMPVGTQPVLFPNTRGAELTDGIASPTATGFNTFLGAGTYLYLAIRKGKAP